MAKRMFPVLHGNNRKDGITNPVMSVPWSIFHFFDEQVMMNHSQPLTRLAERGGLAPMEIYLIVNNRPLRSYSISEMTNAEANQWLADYVARICNVCEKTPRYSSDGRCQACGELYAYYDEDFDNLGKNLATVGMLHYAWLVGYYHMVNHPYPSSLDNRWVPGEGIAAPKWIK